MRVALPSESELITPEKDPLKNPDATRSVHAPGVENSFLGSGLATIINLTEDHHMGWWNDQGKEDTSRIYGYVLESFDGYNPVPFPGALVLFASGLPAVMGMKRRRQG
jgi:hypothetical protein